MGYLKIKQKSIEMGKLRKCDHKKTIDSRMVQGQLIVVQISIKIFGYVHSNYGKFFGNNVIEKTIITESVVEQKHTGHVACITILTFVIYSN